MMKVWDESFASRQILIQVKRVNIYIGYIYIYMIEGNNKCGLYFFSRRHDNNIIVDLHVWE